MLLQKCTLYLFQSLVKVIVSNLSFRSPSYLQLEMFKLALKDVNKVLEIETDHQETINQIIESLRGLGMHKETLEVVECKFTAKELVKDQLQQELLKSLDNHIVHSKGEYNILEMINISTPTLWDILQNKCMDSIGEYNGPIKVVLIP